MSGQTAEGPTIRIPRSRSLDEKLAQLLAAGDRPSLVSGGKELRQRDLARIAKNQLDNINEVTGLDVATSITVLTDGLVRTLVAFAADRVQVPADWQERVGVFALGGYGRGELAPHSDIDLLVFHLGSRPDWLQRFNQELQTLLWDVGFQVGASMRAAPELERMLAEDMVTATAVLEQRLLVGSDAIEEELRGIRERFRKRRGRVFLRYKVEELRERQQKAGANLFTMEPNTKTNPGCLRDIQLLRNISFILFGSRNLHALRDMDVIDFEDVRNLFEANDRLLAMRSLLHARHKRHEDRLSLQDQLWLADCFGYSTGGRIRAVEQMMRLHYERVLHVHQIVELAVSRLSALGHLGRRLILVKTRRRLNEDFTVIDGKVYVGRREIWGQTDLGERLMRMCRQAQHRRFRLSTELQRAIKAHLYLLLEAPFRHDPQIGRLFLEILGDAGFLRPILADMHWSGLLGAYMPEFGNLTALMQFNSYHQYTADEHTLMVVGNLDQLVLGDEEGFDGCTAIVQRIDRLDLLALALLLHDVGKFMGSGHVPRGALMVGPIADRLGLDEAEEDLVHFLVAEHVTLSDATRFRDIHDPLFLQRLADAIPSRERLELLYVLTWCDIAAVGVGVLTGWQKALAKELFDNIAMQLASQADDGRVPPKRQRLQRALIDAGLAATQAEEFLFRFDDNYVYQAQPGEVAVHQRLWQEAAAAEDGIAIAFEVQESTASILIACPDRHGLFADCTGTISASHYDISEARNWMAENGRCLYVCRVTSNVPGRLASTEVWQRLEQTLRQVLRGERSVQQVLANQSVVMMVDRPPDSGFDAIEVRIEQESSMTTTALDVRVKDQPGVLYVISRTIAELDCSIMYASIATYGDVARDVFYVARDGEKLDARQAGLLQREVEAALIAYQNQST